MRGHEALLAGHLSGLLFLLFWPGRRLPSRLLGRFFLIYLPGRRLCRRLLGPLRCRRSFFGFGSLLGLGFLGYGFLYRGFLSLGLFGIGLFGIGLFGIGLFGIGFFGIGFLGFGFNGLLGFDSLLGRGDLGDLSGFDRSFGFLSLRAFRS